MNRPSFPPRAAFTLAELLTVIAIIALLMSLAGAALFSVNRGRQLARAGYDLVGVLEQARQQAQAANTYTWVGLRETGDQTLEAVIVASRNGDDLPPVANTSDSGSGIVQVGKVFKWPNLKVVDLSGTGSTRPDATPLEKVTPPIYTFVAGTSGTFGQYTIGFNSQGEATVASGTLARCIEIGLQSAVEGKVIQSQDYVAVQIDGLTGNVTLYQP